MGALTAKSILIGTITILVFAAATPLSHFTSSQSLVTPDEFVRALAEQRTSVIDLYFEQHQNPNARVAQDRPLILAATLQQDWETVRRLLDADASVDLADESGLTPIMAAAMQGKIDILRSFIGRVTKVDATDRNGRTALQYAIGAQQADVVEFLLPFMPDLSVRGSELLAAAIDSGNERITGAILERVPKLSIWSQSTRRVLMEAISAGNRDRVKLLLSRHALPPTPEGKDVPLIAYAIASHNPAMLSMLLSCGTDPNTVLPDRLDDDFLALLPSKIANYIDGDKNVNLLMLAAGVGETEYVRALLDAGADRNRSTKKYRMIPLYIAAQTGKWQCAQVLLGSGPSPDELRIEISLGAQHVALIKDGVPIFSTNCSSGRPGYATRAGDYVITDKERNHRSTIYHVDMPYFMRLSCLDFGMHEGVVPNYPASHGCIRLPGEAARKLFAEIPVGTVVTVK